MSLFKNDDENEPASEEASSEDEEEEDPPLEDESPAKEPEPQRDKELEDTLKELAARMSNLQSNVETVKDARGDLEAKLENMESRIHRLGGLAEAVSSEYNPFLTENEAGDPNWDPNEEDPIDPAEASLASDPLTEDPNIGFDEPAPAPPKPSPDAIEEETPSPTPEADHRDLFLKEMDEEAFQTLAETLSENGPEPAPQASNNLRDRFLLLEWVGLMIERVGRAGLLDLMDYYEGLGWVDRSIKDRVLSVAVGLEAQEPTDADGWRADLNLHERSLLAIQHLQGDPVSKAELDALQMDLKRFFNR